MERKTARLTLLIDPYKKLAFERLCALQDRTASQVVRQLIRDYLAEHGVAVPLPGTDVEEAVDTSEAGTDARQPPAAGATPSAGNRRRVR